MPTVGQKYYIILLALLTKHYQTNQSITNLSPNPKLSQTLSNIYLIKVLKKKVN